MSSSGFAKVESIDDPQPQQKVQDEGSQEEEPGEDSALQTPQDTIPEKGAATQDKVETRGPRTCGSMLLGCLGWMNSLPFYVYSSQSLSAWGDRMWGFAVALYLVEIEDNSLRLTALYGFCITASVFFFGAAVGRWVDKTSRLAAVQISLIIQNTFVMINAAALVTILITKDQILPIWNGALFVMLQVVIILLGTVARLSSMAQKIAVQRDWVVVIAGNDRAKLAQMNANIRRIDLSVNILAPIVVGQLMTFGSMLIAGIFIALWNLISMGIEYVLLWKVYYRVPELAVKALPRDSQLSSDTNASSTCNPFSQISNWFTTTWNGFKIYRSYDVFWTGLGLAFLYMTVMGFDSVTTGYGYSLGVQEYLLGIIRALGSLAGITGTILFTYMRKGVGLERTGLYSLIIQIFFLFFCIASIWAPGSPFDPHFIQTRKMLEQAEQGGSSGIDGEYQYELQIVPSGNNSYIAPTSPSAFDPLGTQCLVGIGENTDGAWSAALFFAGMVLSRIGLWAFDLTTTQQIQESVDESQRGVFNGVQKSLECSFDMLHFILVILLPCPESFGYLIMLSVVFICVGAMFYSVYSYKTRGHLVPHFFKNCSQNYSAVQRNSTQNEGESSVPV